MHIGLYIIITSFLAPRYPQTSNKVPLMETFASEIARTRNHPFYINCQQSSTQNQERELTQQFTNLLYQKYKTPLFTIQTSCCKMPTNLAGVWRNNIEKMLNFLNLIKRGVKGYVKSVDGQPLRNATIRVVGNRLAYSVTKNLGHFRIILPTGPIQLAFYCDNYETRTMSVMLNDGAIVDMGDVVLQRLTPGREHVIDVTTTKGEIVVIRDNATGIVTGFVLDTSNRPLEGAKAVAETMKGKLLKQTVADSMGGFKLEDLPMGDLKLTVSSSGMVEGSSVVHVSAFSTSKGNVFHLESDEHVWGMPRLLFIIAMGCLLVGCTACVAFCLTTYQAKKDFKNYSFSLLPQNKDKPLFEDDDDEEEDTELYRAPIKSRSIVGEV